MTRIVDRIVVCNKASGGSRRIVGSRAGRAVTGMAPFAIAHPFPDAGTVVPSVGSLVAPYFHLRVVVVAIDFPVRALFVVPELDSFPVRALPVVPVTDSAPALPLQVVPVADKFPVWA